MHLIFIHYKVQLDTTRYHKYNGKAKGPTVLYVLSTQLNFLLTYPPLNRHLGRNSNALHYTEILILQRDGPSAVNPWTVSTFFSGTMTTPIGRTNLNFLKISSKAFQSSFSVNENYQYHYVNFYSIQFTAPDKIFTLMTDRSCIKGQIMLIVFWQM